VDEYASIILSLKGCSRVFWISEGITRSWLRERGVETSSSVGITAFIVISSLSEQVLQRSHKAKICLIPAQSG
jgi:hypothetical protein